MTEEAAVNPIRGKRLEPLDLHEDNVEIGHSIPKVTLRQLTYFLAAARHQSVLRAAETLNVSSPSISTAISQLEDCLEMQLFERRHARGLLLTPAGMDLVVQARSTLLQVREIETIANRGDSRSTVILNVGCLKTLAPYFLPAIMRHMHSATPYIHARWTEDSHENLMAGLHTGSLDLALLYNYDLPTTFDSTIVRHMPIQVVLPADHSLAGQPSCRLSELADETMILLDQARTRDYFLSLFAKEGFGPKIGYRSPNFETVRSLVANGFGYSLLNFAPPYYAEGHGRLVSRPLVTLARDQALVIARLYRFRRPAMLDELIEAVRHVVAQIPTSC